MGGGVISMLVSAVSAAMTGGRQRATRPSAIGPGMPAIRTVPGSGTNAANRSRSPVPQPSPLNSKANSRNNTPQRSRGKDRDITPQRRLEKKTNGRRPARGTKTRTASFVTGGGDPHNPQPPTGAPPSRQKKNPITIGRFHTADF